VAVLALEAGKTLLLDKDEFIAAAEAAGLAVVGVDAGATHDTVAGRRGRVGYLGKFHAEKYASLDDVDLVAVVTRTRRARARRGALRHDGGHGLPDAVRPRGLRQPGGADAAAPAHRTRLPGARRRRTGRKADDETVADGRALVETAERHHRVLQVGHLERFNPPFARSGRSSRNRASSNATGSPRSWSGAPTSTSSSI